MKKVYVRPTIEIENFEANEYVAACWVVTCGAGESMLTYTQPNTDSNDGDEYVANGGQIRYFGKINGKAGETYPSGDSTFWKWVYKIFGWGNTPYHIVTITSGANGGAKDLNPSHPNASA